MGQTADGGIPGHPTCPNRGHFAFHVHNANFEVVVDDMKIATPYWTSIDHNFDDLNV